MSDKKTLIEQFDTLDSDSSGQIDVAELFKFLSVKDQEVVKNILLSMDRDVDGQISWRNTLRGVLLPTQMSKKRLREPKQRIHPFLYQQQRW